MAATTNQVLNWRGLQTLVSLLKQYSDDSIKKIDKKFWKIVTELPDVADAEESILYLVPNSEGSGNNVYDEYIFTGDTTNPYELLGKATLDMKPENYYNKDEIDNLISQTVSNINTTLSNYYTSEQIDQMIKDIESGELKSLEDYLKIKDAEETYLKKTDLSYIEDEDIESLFE